MSRDSSSSSSSHKLLNKRSSDDKQKNSWDQQRPKPKPRVVIVKPSDRDIKMRHDKDDGDSEEDTDNSEKGDLDDDDDDDDDGIHVGKKQRQQIQQWELLAVDEDSSLTFNFTGAAVAVVGMRNEFPPVPFDAQPKWNCTVRAIGGGVNGQFKPCNLRSQRNFKSDSGNSGHSTKFQIPLDEKKRMCVCSGLDYGEHELRVEIKVSSTLPAYLHSIRYQPFNESTLEDVSLRIDASDKYITYNPKVKWDWTSDGLESKRGQAEGSRTIEVLYRGDTLLWYGTYEIENDGPPPSVYLDGEEYSIPSGSFKNRGKGDTSDQRFKHILNITTDGNRPHNLKVVLDNPSITLKLHHLVAKIGSPLHLNVSHESLTQNGGNTSQNVKSKQHNVSIITASVIGAVIGLLILLLAFFWWIRSRGLGRARWKARRTSASLDPTYGWPASKVSTRSSFSREVVSGDIEYNPEAEKKMEGLRDRRSLTRPPPPAIILHADSGLRIQHLPVAQEVPPRYSYI